MPTISEVNSFDELLKLENEWNPLLEKSYTDTIFLSFEWITSWWKCFGNDKKMLILLVKENKNIIGIAPLMISQVKKLGITINKLEFIGMPLADYADFIISEKNNEVLQEIYDYIMEHKNLWSFVKLNRIPEESPTLSQSKKVFGSKKIFDVFLSDVCPSCIFDDNWELFKEKIDNKKMRKAIRLFKEKGELSLSRFEGDVQEALKLLNIFFEQHKQRWNTTKTPSMFNDDNYKRFFEYLIASLLQKGKIALFYLRFNQKPVAFQLSFLYNNKFLVYSSTYDNTYAKQSPGKILHKFLLEYCALNKFKELDFLRGGEKYKLQFSNTKKKNFSISIHKNIFLHILDYISNKIENKIKENENLYNLFIKYEKKLRIF